MKPGEVWECEAADAPAYARALLSVSLLGISDQHPLAFANGCWLVQLSSAIAPSGAFDSESLLVPGCFLAKYGTLSRRGFRRVDRQPLLASSIDFPWFLADHNNTPCVVRGELIWQHPRLTRERLERWNVRLTISFPSTLQGRITRHRKQFGLNKRGLLLDSPAGDIRTSGLRDEIAAELEIDLNEPYIEAIHRLIGPERVSHYEKLLV